MAPDYIRRAHRAVEMKRSDYFTTDHWDLEDAAGSTALGDAAGSTALRQVADSTAPVPETNVGFTASAAAGSTALPVVDLSLPAEAVAETRMDVEDVLAAMS
eukprot:5148012-Amphidinium_carterae.1